MDKQTISELANNIYEASNKIYYAEHLLEVLEEYEKLKDILRELDKQINNIEALFDTDNEYSEFPDEYEHIKTISEMSFNLDMYVDDVICQIKNKIRNINLNELSEILTASNAIINKLTKE